MGTSAVKTALVSSRGEVASVQTRPITTKLLPGGGAEQDPHEWWAMVRSAATYRRLGQPVAYVRQRGFEPLQQEQMVLQYVDKFGRITRKETCTLCQVGPYQAYRLLKSMEEKGLLIAKGQKKARYYERCM
jgi:ATP-dependent DNA helicase RecG